MITEKLNEAKTSFNKLVEQKRSLLDQADKEKDGAKIKEVRSQIEKLNNEMTDLKATIDDYTALDAEKRSKTVSFNLGNDKEITPEDPTKVTKRMINSYLHKNYRDAINDGLKSADAAVTIPKDIQYVPTEEINTVTDLSTLVQHFNATTASGEYPIVKRATASMHTVAELEKNPALAKPEFIKIAWSVDTYRGAIPLSQESIEDSQADLLAIVANNAREQKVNTTNAKISALLKAFTAKSVGGDNIDQIKHILNVDLDPAYSRVIIASQSFYQYLDTLKDKNGRYLLQEPITQGSPSLLIGVPVIKVEDTALGKAGEAHAFIGDIKRAILMADRKDLEIKWTDSEIYGQYLGLVMRFGLVTADSKAGYFVTATPSTTGA